MYNVLDEKYKEPSPASILLQRVKYIATSLCLVFICYWDLPPVKNEVNRDIILPITPSREMIVDRDTVPEMRKFDREKEPYQELERRESVAKEKK